MSGGEQSPLNNSPVTSPGITKGGNMNISDKQRIVKIINSDKLLAETCKDLNRLRKLGKSDAEIESIIKGLHLPLKHHLFITGNYSCIMSLNYE